MDQLLEAGADPSASTTAEPEGEARRQLKLEIHENNRVRLQGPGRGGEIYIRRGYNVRNYEERFKRPLHFAAQKGHRNIVKILLNADVDASATTYHKRTALYYAAIENHQDVFQLLLEASIDISKRDYSGVAASGYAFSPPIASVETNTNKCLCQSPSTAHQVRNATSPKPFPSQASFPVPFPSFQGPRHEVDSSATSS